METYAEEKFLDKWKEKCKLFTTATPVLRDRRFSELWRRSYRPGASIVNAPSRSMGKS